MKLAREANCSVAAWFNRWQIGPLQGDRDETVDGHDMPDQNLTQVTRTG